MGFYSGLDRYGFSGLLPGGDRPLALAQEGFEDIGWATVKYVGGPAAFVLTGGDVVPDYATFDAGRARFESGDFTHDELRDAWKGVDKEIFHGWWPGGAKPEVPDVLKDFGKLALAAGVVLAAVVLGGRR